MEQTLSIIKPDALARNITGEVNTYCEKVGKIIAQKMIKLSPEQVAAFYSVHSDKPFFETLCQVMSSGKVIVQVLHGDNVVSLYREIMGATNPSAAKEGTIRKHLGISVEENTVHGSDSLENAKLEIEFFFAKADLI